MSVAVDPQKQPKFTGRKSWVSAFQLQRQAGGDQRDLIANGGDALVEPPLFVGEYPRYRVHRHDAPANFVGHQNDVAGQGGEQFDQW